MPSWTDMVDSPCQEQTSLIIDSEAKSKKARRQAEVPTRERGVSSQLGYRPTAFTATADPRRQRVSAARCGPRDDIVYGFPSGHYNGLLM